jgi:hypothetical protein
MIILRIGCYLIAVLFQIFLETMVMMIEIGYAMNKTDSKCKSIKVEHSVH